MTTLIFTDDLARLPEGSGDETVVTFSKSVCDACPSERSCVLATDYVTNSEELIDSDDYALMRSWLANHASHDGIDIGSLLQSQFIYLFGTQFYRQFRAVRATVEAESPDHIKVKSKKRLPYEWLEPGSSNLYTPIFECLAGEYNFTLDVTETGTTERVKASLFNIAGPLALRGLEHVTESTTRFRDRTSDVAADVLVFLSNTNNLCALLPVWQELQRRDVEVTVVYHAFGVTNYDMSPLETLRDTGVTVQSFESYMDRSAYKTARARNRDFKRHWRTVHDDERFHNRFELDGIPVWNALEERFQLHYRFHYQRIVRFIEAGRNIINLIEPDAVIFKGVGPKSTRTFATVANEAGVPTVMVQHGKSNPIQSFEPLVNHVAAWGELSKEFLMTRGYDPDNVTVTGSPKFDHLHDLEIDEDHLRTELGIDDVSDVLMLASQPLSKDVRHTIVTAVCESLESMSDVVLLIRPHPREDGALLQDIAAQYDVETAYAPHQDIHHLVELVDVVTGINSTVLFEASLMDTPAIVLDFTDEPIRGFWSQEGFDLVDTATDLPSVVRRILRDESYRESVLSSQPSMGMRYAHNEDGRATERIADFITSL